MTSPAAQWAAVVARLHTWPTPPTADETAILRANTASWSRLDELIVALDAADPTTATIHGVWADAARRLHRAKTERARR